MEKMTGQKVVLAYSGGLDTSVSLKWLINKGFEVIFPLSKKKLTLPAPQKYL